jgi:Flp pilus assembly protein TadG
LRRSGRLDPYTEEELAMLYQTPGGHRPAATLIENAIVMPLTMFLLFGLIVGGLGVFRYQQVASLAREASRYAAVHGTDYATEVLGDPSKYAHQADIDAWVRNRAVGLDLNRLAPVQVTWGNPPPPPSDIVSVPPGAPAVVSPSRGYVVNNVTVTVTYTWVPELYLLGPYTLTSQSTVPVSY